MYLRIGIYKNRLIPFAFQKVLVIAIIGVVSKLVMSTSSCTIFSFYLFLNEHA